MLAVRVVGFMWIAMWLSRSTRVSCESIDGVRVSREHLQWTIQPIFIIILKMKMISFHFRKSLACFAAVSLRKFDLKLLAVRHRRPRDGLGI